MNKQLRELIELLKTGKIDEESFFKKAEEARQYRLPFAHIDHHRHIRQGFPEVIFCQGKTIEQIIAISKRILEQHGLLLATRASEEIYTAVQKELPELHYHPQARCIHSALPQADKQHYHKAGIICAGTSDIPVAEEAALTLRMFGFEPVTVYDVGVAGIHRLESRWEQLSECYVFIVAAGMEGALPSVVGGLVDKPVIAVPTSVGYGANFQGISALLAMLNSCASNVTVVNIDNGFGAGFVAAQMLRQIKRALKEEKSS